MGRWSLSWALTTAPSLRRRCGVPHPPGDGLAAAGIEAFLEVFETERDLRGARAEIERAGRIFERVRAVYETCMAHPAFQAADPARCPDAE